MVFVNGVRLNQVMFSGELQPGTFWADSNWGNKSDLPLATVRDNMATADVELATASRSPPLGTDGVNNFVIRGLSFVYDNSCTQQGLRLTNATNMS